MKIKTAFVVLISSLSIYISILSIFESSTLLNESNYNHGNSMQDKQRKRMEMLNHFYLHSVDAGFTDISSSKLSCMTYIWSEVVTSTGTNATIIMINPVSTLNLGTTYYSLGANSKMVCDPKGTQTTTQGKYVHAQFYVNYWVSMSSEIGK